MHIIYMRVAAMSIFILDYSKLFYTFLIISKILFYFRFEVHVSYTHCTIYLNYFKTFFNIA